MTTKRPLSAWRTLGIDRFLLGVPHYPEHVEASFLERDAERIAAAGFNVVRMGEFAWNLFEPEPGRYDFALFDRAVAGLVAHGVDPMICTPTPPTPRRRAHAHRHSAALADLCRTRPAADHRRRHAAPARLPATRGQHQPALPRAQPPYHPRYG